VPDIKPMLNLNIFDSAKPNRGSETIVEQIRRAIPQGKLRPGDRLPPEHKLVEKFQTSKFSVREALRSLEIFGFLEVKKGPGGGAIVTEVDSKPIRNSIFNFLQFKNITVRNVSEARIIIENGVAGIEAITRKKEDLIKMRRILEKTERQVDLGRNVGDYNIEFHLTLAESSHKPILFLTLDYVLDLLKQTVKILRPDKQLEFSLSNLRAHWEILEAIQDGDLYKAKKVMTNHLQTVEKRMKPLEEMIKLEDR
jgi:GntR family transcriptional repressor for pyruvate dehydrogenase complex